jgi:hypothetical protein
MGTGQFGIDGNRRARRPAAHAASGLAPGVHQLATVRTLAEVIGEDGTLLD